MYSKDGYKINSKDRNNPFNIIPSGNITMEDVDFPVMGTDNFGNQKLMMPGANYTFPGNEVFEVPYNLDRARQLNFPERAPDDYNMLVENRPHWGSVDPESGDWLKSMDHPTAWMEYMNYALSPRSLDTDVVVDPSGHFGDRQLKYIPEAQRGTFIKKLIKEAKGLKKYFSKTKKGDIILDKNLQLLHGTKNPNLTLKDIELTEAYKTLTSRQNSTLRRIKESKKDGTFVSGDEI